MSDAATLSSSLEDYLEVIFHLVAAKQVARVKDIAKKIQVKNSSVTGALRSLADKGLINYTPYDVVTLTPKGTDTAADVVRRHEVLRDFFINVLAVEAEEADQAACRMEHCISPVILERFVQFTAYIEHCPRNSSRWVPGSGFRCRHEVSKESCEQCIASLLEQSRAASPSLKKSIITTSPLHRLRPGQKGRIVKVRARGETHKRILEMGVIPGAWIEVERVAPLGDPIQVKIKGYHLTLRKEEAVGIEVEPALVLADIPAPAA